MSQLPAMVNLDAYRGDTWAQTFRFLQGDTPLDLTAATVAAWARRTNTHQVLTVTTNGTPGEVTIGQPEGGLTPGQWQYDVEVTADGTVTTWVRGNLTVVADVTNAP